MRIDPNLAIAPTALDSQKPQAPSRPAPAPAESPSSYSGSERVALSQAATTAVSDSQPTITSRIEKIRSLLERGAYPIDLDVLAARIVDDETLRAGRPS